MWKWGQKNLGAKKINPADKFSGTMMVVDLDVVDATSKAVSTDASNHDEKPAEFVTTSNVIDLAHNSPITESSAADVVDDALLPHTRRHTGHVQKYPHHIE